MVEVTLGAKQAPAGVWHNEPDLCAWIEGVYVGLVIRHATLLHLCGYVIVPSKHPLHGVEYSDYTMQQRLMLTEEITYADLTDHLMTPSLPHGYWAIGFDCAHSFDFCPGSPLYGGTPADYKTFDVVKARARVLLNELKVMEVD